MTKMLLIGELNDTLQSLAGYLNEDFQVQMCSENAKNVKDFIRIYRPGILVFHILEWSSDVQEIFEMLREKLDVIPIIIIVTRDMEEQLNSQTISFKNQLVLYRPIKGRDVLEGCFRLLNMEAPKHEEHAAASRKRIMIIDDSALVLREIKNMLEKDYEVVLANSGERGLSLIEKKRPDLILLDYDMPGMDGRETFEKIKAEEETMDIPVVFLTAVAERDPILEVLKNLPQGYILKPPSKEKLFSVIKEVLGEA